jgi:hypothetical protein
MTDTTAPTAQLAFLADITARLRDDPRIRAAWLIGSLAGDNADAFSDVDLLLAVADDALTALVADWRAFVAGLSPTIALQRIGQDTKPTFVTIAPGYLRFDLTLCAAGIPQRHGYDPTRLLFDHDGVAARMTFAPRASDNLAEQLPALVHEFIRCLGLTPIVLGREELLISRQGVAIVQTQLIDLYLLENGGRRGGGKHLNSALTAEQYDAFASFPPLELTRDSLLASLLTAARLFLPHARRLMQAQGLPYPDEFERETLAYLRRTLDVELWPAG